MVGGMMALVSLLPTQPENCRPQHLCWLTFCGRFLSLQ